MYLVDVAGRALLAILFDLATTLGLMRLKLKDLLPGLAAVFADLSGARRVPGAGLDAGWVDAAQDEIDRLFVD